MFTQKRLFLFSFILCSSAFAMNEPPRNLLQEARAKLACKGNVYNPSPTDATETLSRARVVNKYYADLESQGFAAIDKTLEEILNVNFTPEGWAEKRLHLAALAYIKANMNISGRTGTALALAVDENDLALVRLLCNTNAKPKETCALLSTDPLLFAARSDSMAQFLLWGLGLHRGLDHTKTNVLKRTVLMNAMSPTHSTSLVTYYSYKLDSFDTDKYQWTALHHLAAHSQDHTAEQVEVKAEDLFAKLSPEKVRQLCRMQDIYGKTAFDLTRQKMEDEEIKRRDRGGTQALFSMLEKLR